jgi:hypothetical protein
LAERAVSCEPLSGPGNLIFRENTGK